MHRRDSQPLRLLCVLLLLLASCSGDDAKPSRPKPTDVPIHLLQRWPAQGERAIVALGAECFDAAAVDIPSEVRLQLTLPSPGVLEVALGARDLQERVLLFEINWTPEGGEPTSLLSESIDDDSWHSRRVRIPEALRGPGELALRVRSKGDAAPNAVAFWGSPVWDPDERSDRPNFVLILLDTLRADHVGVYGHDVDTTPRLDALAARGTVFRRAISHAPWTLPSTMSILTSTHPSVHRMFATDRELAGSLTTVAECFRAAGYRTAAFTEGGMVDAQFGFARGFERYHNGNAERDAGETFERARAWLRDRTDSATFVLVHTYQPHVPYRPPRGYLDQVSSPAERGDVHPRLRLGFDANKALLGRRADAKDDAPAPLERPFTFDDLEYIQRLYDGEIRYADEVVGGLLAELDASGERQRTHMVVTSDHGEDFFDHYAFGLHAHSLFEELLHVPLIFAGPGIAAGGSVTPAVGHVDLAPTLLELAGIEVPSTFTGRSLVPALRGRDLPDERPVFSERPPTLRSVTTSRYKLIRATADATERARQRLAVQGKQMRRLIELDIDPLFTDLEGIPAERMLFDLGEDPAERTNLAMQREDLLRGLERALERQTEHDRQIAPDDFRRRKLSPELEEHLRRLGYLGEDW